MRQSISLFLTEVVSLRYVVYELAKRDFQRQYRGSYFGLMWMFLQPLIMIFVLYLVFTIGFKVEAVNDGVPFALYLTAGMIGWNFFSTNLITTVGVLEEYAFLVKKANFTLSILPFIKLLSGMVSHVFLIIVAVALCWFDEYRPTWYTFQILYYLFSMQVLLTGLGWLTSSTNIFVQDVSKIVEVITQFGFWLTPVFWNINSVPDQYHWIIKINPVYYIVSGYRDSLIMQIGFWEKPGETVTYWMTTLAIVFLGIMVHRKLRPHFAEMI